MILIFIVIILVPLLLKRNIQDLFKKTAFTTDKLFEDFICDDFFVSEKYELTAVPDIVVLADSVFTELIFTQISSGYQFFIKPKFYTKIRAQEIEYCTSKEFLYLKHEIKIPVYIFLGIDGPAYFPNNLFLIPLNRLTSNKINMEYLPEYAVLYNNHDIDFGSHQ